MKNAEKKTIVVSGINMTTSGILSILTDALAFLHRYADGKNIRIIALVPSKALVGDLPGVEFHEFPRSKQAWVFRIYYEYFYFRSFSKKVKPDIWLSLHDISPRIVAERRFVYCHNPSPFFHPRLADWMMDFKGSLFAVFYTYLYRLNIKSNTGVIVQQNWINDAFRQMYGLDRVVTAHPEIKIPVSAGNLTLESGKYHFFYPAFPRTFKNFEIIGQAVELLSPEVRNQIRIHLTIDGEKNRYSRHIVSKFGHLPELVFCGLLTRMQVAEYYQACDALLFPSKVETWGLPITEAKAFHKKIFVSDLPYAHETVGEYRDAWFFDPEHPAQLARLIGQMVGGNLPETHPKPVRQPDFNSWDSLFDYIFARTSS